ncbi:uncharacterized protein IL334_006381 [Kwoniella shivajii]|uniref:DUF292-domain-containing protein n=1 Tax=Kwoniella shivajii TaxID=564305 RepID=A0ABZ1D5T4_9TREE|nr:hypothetical protein IL334_006381 [Kwoniella shivajii]
MVPWNGPRAKVQIKLSIQRLRTLQEKKLALAKLSRREIADLVGKGRIETARLRVEGLVQDDIYVELLEVLELYVETLQARFNLLDSSTGETPEPSISDAVCSIVYAAPRTELKELQVLRELLMHKYGRNFSISLLPSTPPPTLVPPRVLSKLSVFVPSKELVDAYLSEIAKGYGVSWVPETVAEDQDDVEPLQRDRRDDDENSNNGHDGDEGDNENGQEAGKGSKDGNEEEQKDITKKKEKDTSPEKKVPSPKPPPAKKLSEEEELAQRFERLKNLR